MEQSDEILIELSNDEIQSFLEFYKNVENKLDVLYVPLYLLCQLNWNQKFKSMSELEVDGISDRCKQKFFKPKNGTRENATIIGMTGEKVGKKLSISNKFILIIFSGL